MTVWRGFTLVLWVVILTVCLSIFLVYNVLERSVLDANTTKKWLAESSTYETLRDNVMTEVVDDSLKQRFPDNKLIGSTLVREGLKQAVPEDLIQNRVEPIIDVTYRWLDSKEPEVAFSTSFADLKDSFYKAFEKLVLARIASLPVCASYNYPPEAAVLNSRCRPDYVSAKEATQAVMGGLRSSEFPLADISNKTFENQTETLDKLNGIPTFLNFVWVVHLVAGVLAVLIALLLLASRRAVGIIAIGVSLVLSALIVWGTSFPVRVLPKPDLGDFTATATAVQDAITPHVVEVINYHALISLGIGAVAIAIGLVLRRRGSKASHKKAAKGKVELASAEKTDEHDGAE